MSLEDAIKRAVAIRGESRKAGASFLQTELATSMTFAQAALSAGDNVAKRKRNQAHARRGYDTLLRLTKRFAVPPSAAQEFDEKLARLKDALLKLGDTDV